MAAPRKILLTFDVEEFDIPLEYKQRISLDEQLSVGKSGLDALTQLINGHQVSSTLFTTANFADHFPAEIKELAQQHEIASHTYYHSRFDTPDLLASRLKLEEITGKPVAGLRMPRFKKVAMEDVKNAGYLYDSSINPTWVPGRYNNRHLPRTIFEEDGMIRVPASVSAFLRIPLFWLAFKNIPYKYFRILTTQALRKDGYVCLYMHPWEFTDLSQYKLPIYVKRWSGQRLCERLERLVTDLKQEGEFATMRSVINQKEYR